MRHGQIIQAHVSVVGVVDGQSTIRSPGLSGQLAEMKKTEDKKATSSKPAKSYRPSSSMDSRIEKLDEKWSDCFNQLEAFLLARTLDRRQEPAFTTVKVTPSHGPPANVVRTEPFLKPTDQPSSQHTDSSVSAATDPSSSKHKATEKSVSDLSQASHRTASVEPTGQPVVRPTFSAVEPTKDSFSSDSDTDSFTSD